MSSSLAGSTPVFWFTGLSGAGKSTVSAAAKARLTPEGLRVLVLDGDEIRRLHHKALGFSEADIKTNNALIVDHCLQVRADFDLLIVSIISPYRSSRADARNRLGPAFFETYCDASVDVVRERDVKGLYALADQKKITNLIGYSPGCAYEPPDQPDLVLQTGIDSEETVVDTFVEFVLARLRTA
jgi:adenylyl-sulfate kinase